MSIPGLSLLTGLSGPWPLLIGAGALSLTVAYGTYWVTSRVYQTELAVLRQHNAEASAASAQATLAQFSRDTGVIHAAALGFASAQTNLQSTISTLTEAFNAEVAAHPTDPKCRPSPERVRILKAAILAANSTTGPTASSPLRADHGTQH